MLTAMQGRCWDYQFSMMASSGQWLYFNIVDGGAQITYPNFSPSNGYYHNSGVPTGSLVIPDSVTYNGTTYPVTSIRDHAFYNCNVLTSVTIPSSIVSIGSDAFYNCGVNSVNFTGTIAQWCTISFGNSFSNPTYRTHTLKINGSPITNLIIPNGVTAISNYAFINCYYITSMTIPNSITTLASNAFWGCSGLNSIAVEMGNTYYDSRNNCNAIIQTSTNTLIVGCKNSIIPNNVTSIGNSAFYKCNGLITITIPNSVTSIGADAFNNCSNMASVTIPTSVTEIGTWAFSNCSSLTSITLPNSVTEISYATFYHCGGLTSITIPNSVTEIGNSAFSGCSGLTSVTIGSSVCSIGDNAFWNCTSLDTVYMMPTTPPSLGTDVFYNNTTDRVFILQGCSYYNYYTSNSNNPWYIYCSYLREPTIDINVNVHSSNATRGTASVVLGSNNTIVRCDSTAIIRAIANTDYHFDHWSNGSTTNPDTVNLTGDTTITAYFIGLTITSNDNTHGSATHTKIGDHLERITATANHGYHFYHWNDGDTNNPRTITLTQDTTFTAHFAPNQYTLMVNAGEHGTATGSGTYNFGDTITIQAFPEEHYHFTRWNDGNTENPRQYRIEDNITLTAFFVIDTYTVSVVSNDIIRGMVEASGTEFVYGTPCTVEATAYTGYTFAGWSNGIIANPYTFAVISNVELTALFVEEGEEVYTVTVESADPTMGTVSGGGQALSGSTLTIRAIPNNGHRFRCWNDGNTENPRTVTVTGNITYTAYFESTQGIGDIDADEIKIFSTGGRIVVQGAERMEMRVFDRIGREVVKATRNGETPALPTGVYLVKVGTLPARKVVVMR